MYDDYFKSIIGGSIKSPEYYDSTYDNRTYEPIQVNSLPGYNYSSSNMQNEESYLDLYPDIYKIVTPMVDKLLDGKDANDVDETKLVNWTVEIYDALEVDDVKQVSAQNNNISRVNNTTNMNNSSNMSNIANMNNSSIMSNSANVNNSTSMSNTTNINNASSMSSSINMTTANSKVQNNQANNIVKIAESSTNNPKTIDVVSRYRNYKNPVLRDLIRILILERLFGKNPRPPRPRTRPYSDIRTSVMPIPDYRSVNTEIFKPYTNYSKTYFDVPYPEE